MLEPSSIPWLTTAPRDQPWLVGVSGGADSVALLHLLADSGFTRLIVCHLDHQLRGRASTEDARFVQRLAKTLQLPCEVGRADLQEETRRGSMETAARHARHRFFAECSIRHNCHRVLLAHHADDQAETILWNLLRGSHGLKGMQDKQEIRVGPTRLQIIRPLLGCRHKDLVDWLKSRGHRWREDASNSEPVAIRNRLRNEVFPLLAEISGRDPVAAFIRSAADFETLQQLEHETASRADVLDPQGRLHLPTLRKFPEPIRRAAIRNFLRDHQIPITRDLLEQAVASINPDAPHTINLPGNRHLRRRAGRMWID